MKVMSMGKKNKGAEFQGLVLDKYSKPPESGQQKERFVSFAARGLL